MDSGTSPLSVSQLKSQLDKLSQHVRSRLENLIDEGNLPSKVIETGTSVVHEFPPLNDSATAHTSAEESRLQSVTARDQAVFLDPTVTLKTVPAFDFETNFDHLRKQCQERITNLSNDGLMDSSVILPQQTTIVNEFLPRNEPESQTNPEAPMVRQMSGMNKSVKIQPYSLYRMATLPAFDSPLNTSSCTLVENKTDKLINENISSDILAQNTSIIYKPPPLIISAAPEASDVIGEPPGSGTPTSNILNSPPSSDPFQINKLQVFNERRPELVECIETLSSSATAACQAQDNSNKFNFVEYPPLNEPISSIANSRTADKSLFARKKSTKRPRGQVNPIRKRIQKTFFNLINEKLKGKIGPSVSTVSQIALSNDSEPEVIHLPQQPVTDSGEIRKDTVQDIKSASDPNAFTEIIEECPNRLPDSSTNADFGNSSSGSLPETKVEIKSEAMDSIDSDSDSTVIMDSDDYNSLGDVPADPLAATSPLQLDDGSHDGDDTTSDVASNKLSVNHPVEGSVPTANCEDEPPARVEILPGLLPVKVEEPLSDTPKKPLSVCFPLDSNRPSVIVRDIQLRSHNEMLTDGASDDDRQEDRILPDRPTRPTLGDTGAEYPQSGSEDPSSLIMSTNVPESSDRGDIKCAVSMSADCAPSLQPSQPADPVPAFPMGAFPNGIPPEVLELYLNMPDIKKELESVPAIIVDEDSASEEKEESLESSQALSLSQNICENYEELRKTEKAIELLAFSEVAPAYVETAGNWEQLMGKIKYQEALLVNCVPARGNLFKCKLCSKLIKLNNTAATKHLRRAHTYVPKSDPTGLYFTIILNTRRTISVDASDESSLSDTGFSNHERKSRVKTSNKRMQESRSSNTETVVSVHTQNSNPSCEANPCTSVERVSDNNTVVNVTNKIKQSKMPSAKIEQNTRTVDLVDKPISSAGANKISAINASGLNQVHDLGTNIVTENTINDVESTASADDHDESDDNDDNDFCPSGEDDNDPDYEPESSDYDNKLVEDLELTDKVPVETPSSDQIIRDSVNEKEPCVPNVDNAATTNDASGNKTERVLCTVCNFEVNNLEAHNKFAHNVMYTCGFCKEQFYLIKNMRGHLWAGHRVHKMFSNYYRTESSVNVPKIKSFRSMSSYLVCNFCKRIVPDFDSFVTHLQKRHNMTVPNPSDFVTTVTTRVGSGGPDGVCNICKMLASNLKEHMEDAHTWAYRCKVCGKGAFYRPRLAKEHVEKHHPEKSEVSEVLVSFSTASIPVKLYKSKRKCLECGKYYQNLDKHMVKHFSVACRICKKKFKKESSLKPHLVGHSIAANNDKDVKKYFVNVPRERVEPPELVKAQLALTSALIPACSENILNKEEEKDATCDKISDKGNIPPSASSSNPPQNNSKKSKKIETAIKTRSALDNGKAILSITGKSTNHRFSAQSSDKAGNSEVDSGTSDSSDSNGSDDDCDNFDNHLNDDDEVVTSKACFLEHYICNSCQTTCTDRPSADDHLSKVHNLRAVDFKWCFKAVKVMQVDEIPVQQNDEDVAKTTKVANKPTANTVIPSVQTYIPLLPKNFAPADSYDDNSLKEDFFFFGRRSRRKQKPVQKSTDVQIPMVRNEKSGEVADSIIEKTADTSNTADKLVETSNEDNFAEIVEIPVARPIKFMCNSCQEICNDWESSNAHLLKTHNLSTQDYQFWFTQIDETIGKKLCNLCSNSFIDLEQHKHRVHGCTFKCNMCHVILRYFEIRRHFKNAHKLVDIDFSIYLSEVVPTGKSDVNQIKVVVLKAEMEAAERLLLQKTIKKERNLTSQMDLLRPKVEPQENVDSDSGLSSTETRTSTDKSGNEPVSRATSIAGSSDIGQFDETYQSDHVNDNNESSPHTQYPTRVILQYLNLGSLSFETYYTRGKCQICHLSVGRTHITQHLQSVHGLLRKCIQCNIVFSSIIEITRHIRLNHRSNVNLATLIQWTNTSTDEQKQNAEITRISNSSSCADAESVVPKQSFDTAWACILCDSRFSQLEFINRHLSQDHKVNNSKIKSFISEIMIESSEVNRNAVPLRVNSENISKPTGKSTRQMAKVRETPEDRSNAVNLPNKMNLRGTAEDSSKTGKPCETPVCSPSKMKLRETTQDRTNAAKHCDPSHKETVESSMPYCTICKVEIRGDLSLHNRHFHKCAYKCRICHTLIYCVRNRMSHISNIHGLNSKTSNKYFTTVDTSAMPYKRIRKSTQTGNAASFCQVCQMEVSYMNNHLGRYHQKAFRCTLIGCKRIFYRRDFAERHAKSFHNQWNVPFSELFKIIDSSKIPLPTANVQPNDVPNTPRGHSTEKNKMDPETTGNYCPICCTAVIDLRNHNSYYHKYGYRCRVCNNVFYALNYARKHLGIHRRSLKDFDNLYIKEDTSKIKVTMKAGRKPGFAHTYLAANRHIQEVHSKVDEVKGDINNGSNDQIKETPKECAICQTEVEDLELHCRKGHTTAFTCTICPGQLFYSAVGMRNHFRTIHGESAQDIPVKKVDTSKVPVWKRPGADKCNRCGLYFRPLRLHQKNCTPSCTSKKDLKDLSTPTTAYSCIRCKRMFDSSTLNIKLRAHARVHGLALWKGCYKLVKTSTSRVRTKMQNAECEKCGKLTKYYKAHIAKCTGTLDASTSSHTTHDKTSSPLENSERCDVCERNVLNLEKHINYAHTVAYKCLQCNYITYDYSNKIIGRHARIHGISSEECMTKIKTKDRVLPIKLELKKCNNCNMEFRRLLAHKNYCKGNVNLQSKNIHNFCDVCKTKVDDLQCHNQNAHKTVDQCKICNKIMYLFKSQYSHASRHGLTIGTCFVKIDSSQMPLPERYEICKNCGVVQKNHECKRGECVPSAVNKYQHADSDDDVVVISSNINRIKYEQTEVVVADIDVDEVDITNIKKEQGQYGDKVATAPPIEHCSVCLRPVRNLSLHQAVAHSKGFQCKKCDEPIFRWKLSASTHAIQHHREDDWQHCFRRIDITNGSASMGLDPLDAALTETGKEYCNVCGGYTENVQNHKARFHKKAWICSFCEIFCYNTTECKKHLKVVHGLDWNQTHFNNINTESVPLFSLIEKVSATKRSRPPSKSDLTEASSSKRLRVSSEFSTSYTPVEFPSYCTVCRYDVDDIDQHNRFAHSSALKCKICGYKTLSGGSAAIHARTHLKNKKRIHREGNWRQGKIKSSTINYKDSFEKVDSKFEPLHIQHCPQKCSICGDFVVTLSRHYLELHQMDLFCNICNTIVKDGQKHLALTHGEHEPVLKYCTPVSP